MDIVVKAENISKVYATKSGNVEALKNVNLELKKGIFYAVIGKSGSGKSTLLHVLSGLSRQSCGSIWVQGKKVDEYGDEEMAILRRRYIGFVFQRFNLLDEYSVRNNILMPLKLDGRKADEKFLKEVVENLDIADKLNKFPNELSGGQQQRVAIARSIIAKPQIVFADEPTGNLDKKTSNDTMNLLCESAKKYGQTLVVETHDLDIAQKADCVIQLEDGCVL